MYAYINTPWFYSDICILKIRIRKLGMPVLMFIFSCEWIRGTCLSNMVVSVEVNVARLSVVIYMKRV